MCSTELGGLQLQSDWDSPDFFADWQSHLIPSPRDRGSREVTVVQTQRQQRISRTDAGR